MTNKSEMEKKWWDSYYSFIRSVGGVANITGIDFFKAGWDAKNKLDDWQPIESAPTDGTEILAWDGDYQVVVSFHDGFFQEQITWAIINPTHWKPIKPPRGA